MTKPTGKTPTTLYRLYNADGELLYIGIAGNPGRRFEQHRKDKPWWGTVAEIKVEHFDTRDQAAQAETAAIKHERPLHNVIHNKPESVLDRVLRLEPKAADLLKLTQKAKWGHGCFCAWWYRDQDTAGIRRILSTIVGWSAPEYLLVHRTDLEPDQQAFLASSDAYDALYDACYNNLPDCRPDCHDAVAKRIIRMFLEHTGPWPWVDGMPYPNTPPTLRAEHHGDAVRVPCPHCVIWHEHDPNDIRPTAGCYDGPYFTTGYYIDIPGQPQQPWARGRASLGLAACIISGDQLLLRHPTSDEQRQVAHRILSDLQTPHHAAA